jgi:hypothetical protein
MLSYLNCAPNSRFTTFQNAEKKVTQFQPCRYAIPLRKKCSGLGNTCGAGSGEWRKELWRDSLLDGALGCGFIPLRLSAGSSF